MNNYMEVLTLRVGMMQTGKTMSELDSTAIAMLDDIAHSNAGTAGAQARGWLESYYGHHFCDCLNITDNQSFKSTAINPALFNQASGVSCTADPNPASDWVSFNYTLPDSEVEGFIKISDVNGKIIETFTVTGLQGQKVWDTRKTDSGIYFYTFTVNGISKSGKLVINK